MMHFPIQAAAARNKYNYDILFEKIVDDLNDADITFANLETPVDQSADVSGYPRFNARPELLASLKKAGVDIVSLANNHAMDAGADGLARTLENISAAGILYTGAGKTKAEAAEIRYAAARGVNVAFLAYTYSTNQRLPGKKESLPGVNVLRPGSKADLGRAAEMVKKARASADLVVVSLHWGKEYATTPTPWQRTAAAELVEAGADVILGHHPHVLQPIETYIAKDGRQGVVAYSLGNFLSNQNYGVSHKNKDHVRALRGDGVILRITVEKKDGKTAVSRLEYLPIWTLREVIGGRTVSRPISLSRELVRLEALQVRSKEEEKMKELLSFRQKVIAETCAVKVR